MKIHEHGFVNLIDWMPAKFDESNDIHYPGEGGLDRITLCDAAIVQAARVSTGQGLKSIIEDIGLIRYLMRHKHTSPFEMVEFKFHCSMPIFVARQWIRHRTANVNEVSARYTELKDEFWIPELEDIRGQSTKNKQVGSGKIEGNNASHFIANLEDNSAMSYQNYLKAIKNGVCREQARALLPVNVYTQWYWKIDLHNLFHFLQLRMDNHAQEEIRVYAEAMFELIKPICPIACQAFIDFRLNSLTLTGPEIQAWKTKETNHLSKSELIEWESKMEKLLGVGQ